MFNMSIQLSCFRREHQKAMNKMCLPRDAMAKFTGKHFTYESVHDEEVSFIIAHKVSLIVTRKQTL